MSEFMAYLPLQWLVCLKAMSVCYLYLHWWIMGIVVLMDESIISFSGSWWGAWLFDQMLNTTYSQNSN